MTTIQSNAIASAIAPVAEDIERFVSSVVENAQAHTMHRSWYAIAKKSDTEAEVRIYEDIGTFGVSAKQFADDLEKIGAQTLHVRLNTYGGEAFDGIAIHNALKAHSAKVVVHVDGIAASSGSIIAMSGDEIRMANNAFLMIHEARGGVMGEAGDLRDYADILDKLNDAIASTYQGRAGRTRKYWRDAMAEESWFTAEEAKAEGLIDIIEEPNKSAKNRFDFAPMNHVPDAARKQWGAPIENKPDAAPATAANVETQPVPQQLQAASDVPAPAPLSKEQTMAQDNAPATPAPIPAAPVDEIRDLNVQTVQAMIAQHRADERTRTEQEIMDRFEAIVAAAPNDPEMVIKAFKGKQTPDAVRMAYELASSVRATAQREHEAQAREIARLQLVAATGGYTGSVFMSQPANDGEDRPAVEPKDQAEAEWARNHDNCRTRFSKKENYVIIRTKELEGRFSMSVASES
jgi:ATP-dependent protease ClpP protease subunit